jgi:hypothetical protein
VLNEKVPHQDDGTYHDLTTDRRGRPIPLTGAIERGHASFWMDGHKLRGGDGEREDWLLVKRSDQHAEASPTPDPKRARSALSGYTLRQTAAEAERRTG